MPGIQSAYVCACGMIWCDFADKDAGWELVLALASEEPEIREIATAALAKAGPVSVSLIEEALTLKSISPEQAAQCLVAILSALPSGILATDN